MIRTLPSSIDFDVVMSPSPNPWNHSTRKNVFTSQAGENPGISKSLVFMGFCWVTPKSNNFVRKCVGNLCWFAGFSWFLLGHTKKKPTFVEVNDPELDLCGMTYWQIGKIDVASIFPEAFQFIPEIDLFSNF
jgi:hypothetical protein